MLSTFAWLISRTPSTARTGAGRPASRMPSARATPPRTSTRRKKSGWVRIDPSVEPSRVARTEPHTAQRDQALKSATGGGTLEGCAPRVKRRALVSGRGARAARRGSAMRMSAADRATAAPGGASQATSSPAPSAPMTSSSVGIADVERLARRDVEAGAAPRGRSPDAACGGRSRPRSRVASKMAVEAMARQHRHGRSTRGRSSTPARGGSGRPSVASISACPAGSSVEAGQVPHVGRRQRLGRRVVGADAAPGRERSGRATSTSRCSGSRSATISIETARSAARKASKTAASARCRERLAQPLERAGPGGARKWTSVPNRSKTTAR